MLERNKHCKAGLKIKMHKWNHFQLPQGVLSTDRPYELIVYANENNEFFFFGNSIFWCLGYDKPHEAVQALISEEKKFVPLGSGIFLNESTVQREISRKLQQDNNFSKLSEWFNLYLQNCKRDASFPFCPSA